MTVIYVNMFGEFTIRTEDKTISDSDNRSRKVWLLLAYLIYYRDRVIKPHELQGLLWTESESEQKSPGALKTLFYRLRMELDNLWEGAGKQLVLYRNGGYVWNNEFPIVLDCEQFDKLYEEINTSPTILVDKTIELLSMYRGNFLSRYSMEFWVTPNTVYFHNAYISSLLRILPMLIDLEQYENVFDFCRVASGLEPFHEEIHCYWMKACIALKKRKMAIEIFHTLSDRLSSELGVIPSDETRIVYREAVQTGNESILSVSGLKEQLAEVDSSSGALVCDYNFFRVLYHFMARSVMRGGLAVHLALITIKGNRVTEQDMKRWKRLCFNLEESIRTSMRRGDSVAQCTTSQFVIMLPHANYENSCMVCERIVRSFFKKNSRLDVDINYEVFPIQPDDKENLQWLREPSEN